MSCKGPKYPISGELRHRIVIQTLTQSSDSIGGYTTSWSTFATVWASLEPRLGNELFRGERLEDHITHICKIRYYAGVLPKMRISFDSRTFQIKSVIREGEIKEWMTLLLEEGSAV